jgi:bacteriocin-like protein
MDTIRNEEGEQSRKPIELTEDELAHTSGGTGTVDDGPWCGTHSPGWHPPLPGPTAA